MKDCSICCDSVDKLTFTCPTRGCIYGLCFECLMEAFRDASGANVRLCPFCKKETARPMIESVCGVGAIREVERELRGKVEYDIRKEAMIRDTKTKSMSQYKERANQLYLEVTEALNMKCPRCDQVFHDYDGCNALRCPNASCEAAFCAVCLKDCGNDAHPCARTHGNLYDKSLFEDARKKRERRVVEGLWQRYPSEAFEVKELVQIKLENLNGKPARRQMHRDSSHFIALCKKELDKAIKADRLSLLNVDRIQGQLSLDDVSPRNAIPEEYRLTLVQSSNHKMCIQLSKRKSDYNWQNVALPEEKPRAAKAIENAEDVVIDVLINLKQSLQCCVIALEGATCLYQTEKSSSIRGESRGPDEISLVFHKVGHDGTLHKEIVEPWSLGYSKVIGLNQNQRLMQLKRLVDETPAESLMPKPLQAYVGSSTLQRLFETNEIDKLAPETFNDLNDEQKALANPLSLKIAMECAGPPGTGKTKTITELIRSILHCTNLDVIVLSERNGAIDAIAEKMAHDCFDKKFTGTKSVIKDFALWKDIVAFGSSGMGAFGTMFKMEEKLKVHPEILDCQRVLEGKEAEVGNWREAMLDTLSSSIENLHDLPDDADPFRRADIISRGSKSDFGAPSPILQMIRDVVESLKSVLEIQKLVEEDVSSLISRHPAILEFLIPIDTTKGKHKTSIVEHILGKKDSSWTTKVPIVKRGLSSILTDEAIVKFKSL